MDSREKIFIALTLLCAFSAAFSCGILSVFLKNYTNKVYWHKNTKVMFFSNLVISICLVTVILTDYVWYFVTAPVQPGNCEKHFQWVQRYMGTHIFRFLFNLYVWVNISTLKERFWATCLLSKYENTHGFFGYGQLVISIVMSLACALIFGGDFVASPNCTPFLETKNADNLFPMTYLLAAFLTLILFVSLLYYNTHRKNYKKSGRLSKRYQERENVVVIKYAVHSIFTITLFFTLYTIIQLLLINSESLAYMRNFRTLIVLLLPLHQIFNAYNSVKIEAEKRAKKISRSLDDNRINTFDFQSFDNFYPQPRVSRPEPSYRLSRNRVAVQIPVSQG